MIEKKSVHSYNNKSEKLPLQNLIFVVPCIMLYSSEISQTRCNNCVLFFAMALLYIEIRYFSRHSAGSTTQNDKTVITYNSTTIELLYY